MTLIECAVAAGYGDKFKQFSAAPADDFPTKLQAVGVAADSSATA
jgi:hypothetical protein